MAIVWMGEHADVDRDMVGGKAHSLNRIRARRSPRT